MRKMQKDGVFGFLEKKENKESFLVSFLASFVIVILGVIGTIVSGIFSYLYWLSYFKRLAIPMEFCKEAITPITDLVVTILLALLMAFIISIIILIVLDEIFSKIRQSNVLLILSEAIFVILTIIALFNAIFLSFDVWPGCLFAVYIIIFLTGSYWHTVCTRQLSAFRFSRYAKHVGYVILSIGTFFLILYTVFIYGGHKNRLATTDWYTEIRYCAEERKLKPDQIIKIILFETDDYYYTVEAEYHILDPNNEGQIVVKDLDHTLIDKGSVNTYSEFIHYIYIWEKSKWMPPSDNMILFLIFFIYFYIQLAALFIGWPEKTVINKPSQKPNKSKYQRNK